MTTLLDISSSLLPTRSPTIHAHNHQPISHLHIPIRKGIKTSKKPLCFKVQAAKLPSGVELPKVEPQFKAPFLGFTRTAEIWNSRACMIGLIGTFVVELIINKGILQLIGVDIGKGLDLPL
ncbi:light-harvesting complex-like protein OHP1, chloroplastic isoform X1 [Rhododendron vialii]|uniref:light-harvesting complex-like protein OHP1, chloroplastic isoform X1 n=1 Tax=Rhododendron vialii TaxID=182163 RepID=UPI00265D6B06|nr:light-harvesting complex-like protein OHP1, chloroplastic isoform X1 [Rhododendron vialii]